MNTLCNSHKEQLIEFFENIISFTSEEIAIALDFERIKNNCEPWIVVSFSYSSKLNDKNIEPAMVNSFSEYYIDNANELNQIIEKIKLFDNNYIFDESDWQVTKKTTWDEWGDLPF